MRFLAVRTISLVAFTMLIAWEFWKAFDGYRKEQEEEDRETQKVRSFDDSDLLNEFQFTSRPEDLRLSAIQRLRKQTLAKHCHSRKKDDIFPTGSSWKKGINANAFSNILVSDKHQVLYCVTPKVACTNWKRILLILDGYFKKPEDISSSLAHNFSTGYFRKLSEYSPDEINLRLTTYYKFLFSRHPYTRLISAFRNKFLNAKYKDFRLIFGKYIMRKYRNRQNITKDKRYKIGEGLTFEEFVKFIIDSPIDDRDFWNEHWERIDRLCLPCLIQYDFIGKFETLKPDADYLLRTLDVSDKVSFPNNTATTSKVIVNEYFKNLPPELKDKLYDLYKHDFSMFSYDNPNL